MIAGDKKLLCDSRQMLAAVGRIADAIARDYLAGKLEDFALVGIYEKGVELSEMLEEEIFRRTGYRCGMASLDISMYRDDVGLRSALPLIRETTIPFDMENHRVILVDDVLSTGRTIRAALDAVTDYGRPGLIRLAVLVDRGNVEYPIRADYIGMEMPVPENRKVVVEFAAPGHDGGIFSVSWRKKSKI